MVVDKLDTTFAALSDPTRRAMGIEPTSEVWDAPSNEFMQPPRG